MKSLSSVRGFAARAVLVAASLTLSAPAFAQSDHGAGHGGGHGAGHGDTVNIGRAGVNPTRTINITMGDNFYEPESLSIAHGETIRFVITNTGDFLHEFNINTAASHEAHAPMMEMMFEMGMLEMDKINHAAMEATRGSGHDMTHDEPNSVLVEPGKTAEVIWIFDTQADLEFACNVPGHYASGMVGDLKIAH